MEKMPKKKKLPYSEYMERVVSRKKKSKLREERPTFQEKED